MTDMELAEEIERVVERMPPEAGINLPAEKWRDIIAALRRAHEHPPSGEMVMVPREPTKEMIEAGKDERMECFKTEGRETNPISVGEALTRIYRAMLSACEEKK